MKALQKDTLKEIKHSRSRFISIIIIIALGVCFFSGIKTACPSMKETVEKYIGEQHLMDIHLVSTWGFTEDDLTALRKTSGVGHVNGGYSTDCIVQKGDKRPVFKVYSLPGQGEQNQPKLMEGRLPQSDSECVIEYLDPNGTYQNGTRPYTIGDTITMTQEQGDQTIGDKLHRDAFTIVGFVRSPLYLSFERGSTSLGSGDVSYYMMVRPGVFCAQRYTDAYVQTSETVSGLSPYSDRYDQTVESLKTTLKTVGNKRLQDNYDQIKKDGQEQIDDAKDQLSDAQNTFDTQIAQGEQQIAESEKKLASGRAELAAGWQIYNNKISAAEDKITASEALLNDKETSYSNGEAAWASGQQQLTDAKNTFQDKKNLADQQTAALDDQLQLVQTTIAGLESRIKALEASDPEDPSLPELRKQLAQAQAGEQKIQAGLDKIAGELSAGQQKIDASEAKLTASQTALEQGREELDAGWQQLEAGKQELATQKQQGLDKLNASQRQIDQGQEQLDQGKAELEEQRTAGQQKLDEAAQKIADSEKQLADLSLGKWYIFDRGDNPGYTSYGQDADRINNLANVFPLFFFSVALLVAFTSMTRMVEEERMAIGTLKALGYSNGQIASKYILYALLASVTGAVFGAVLGVNTLPRLIASAYALLYQVPSLTIKVAWIPTVVSAIFAVAVTVGAAALICRGELVHRPAALMRPKAPKVGKRIFLERIKPVWNRMGFISKVTARNIFRYKARFLMTVIGIAGCTALILAGFGLQDSIFSIVPKQFNEITTYDGYMAFKKEGTAAEKADFEKRLAADSRIQNEMVIKMSKMTMEKKGGGQSKEATLFVPSDVSKMSRFIHLKHRTDNKTVTLSDDGAVITEKLAKDTGVQVGDTIRIYADEQELTIKVTDITENYLNHYIYMTPKAYEQAGGGTIHYNLAYFNLKETDTTTEDQLASQWLGQNDVSSVSYTTNVIKNANDTMSSLNIVVVVMLVSAGILAFVVLYNLTNINVAERVREIATIRVLGFVDKEVNWYVFRENVVLSLIGMVAGLGIGILLNDFIITTVETDVVMFGRGIEPTSYLYACLFTMAFTFIVNELMKPVIKRVDMVESLKSIE
ncbi:MAG: ABC transporter permease [Eubacteriaceae bacterium]|nr:ABC transporter permease [Eubacteriaceae bacterium]